MDRSKETTPSKTGKESKCLPHQAVCGVQDMKEKISIPVNPIIHAALRAIYAGGSKNRWTAASFGQPQYLYEARDGRITFFCALPPDFRSRFHPSIAMFYTPRLKFTYAGSMREVVRNLSVETSDVFLILMSKIARLRDPGRDTAKINLQEIARLRGVRVRHGSAQVLREDFKREVLRLADICLIARWRDYIGGGTITFGRHRADRLLDIVDVEYRRDREEWTAFRFRCGQALSHFLNPEGLRWIGYYSRSLLQLSPYHDAFTKKVGTYWIMIGTAAGKRGTQPHATPKTIMDFCGEDINLRNPGRTVDAFINAHQRLVEIGVLDHAPDLEPAARTKGYLENWLEVPLTVKLSENLWRIKDVKERRRLSPPEKSQETGMKRDRKIPSPGIPASAAELQKNPACILQFRTDYFFRQAELARALGVNRQTLSCYERGLRPLPEDKASKILHIWRQKIRSWGSHDPR